MQIKLTIAGLNIESEESPIALLGNANVLLTLVGTNTLVCSETEAGRYMTAGIQAPAGITLTVGGTGALSVTGGYQGAGIGGDYGDGGSVSISNAAVTATGYYHAIGGGRTENSYGCKKIDIGENVTMDLSFTQKNGSLYQERIDINAQPSSSAALAGNCPVMQTSASGYSGVSYQWQVKNGSNWEDMPGQTNAEANIPMTAENDGATYRCAITNGWGNTIYTNEVQSYILAFQTQPQSVQTNLNEMAGLTVESTCSNVTYQWQRSYDGETWADVPGKTSPTLVLSTTHSENGAYYRCVITATNGDTLASDAAQITVNSSAVTYKTDYYLQNADGTYTMTERVSTEAEAGVSVTAPEKQFDHYTEVTTKGTHTGTVAADGSLTLSRYYDRVKYTLSFEEDGGAELPSITAMHGAAVSLPETVSRRGYTFEGWYLDKDLTQEANITVMPTQDTTLYAKWTAVGEGRGQEYTINGITLLGSDYEPAQGIPAGGFYAQVSVTNLCSSSMDTLILTAYDEDGRIQDMYFLYANPPVGYTFTFGAWIDNSDGKIAELRAIIIPMLGGSMIPLAQGVGVK